VPGVQWVNRLVVASLGRDVNCDMYPAVHGKHWCNHHRARFILTNGYAECSRNNLANNRLFEFKLRQSLSEAGIRALGPCGAYAHGRLYTVSSGSIISRHQHLRL